MESNTAVGPEDAPVHEKHADSDPRQLIRASMKFKSRSHDTHHAGHLPVLDQIPALGFTTVLIGDSMIERLQTTGASTRTANLASSFNAGVGGDRIESVLYRLDLGLFTRLQDRGIQVWVLMLGTNHMGKKKKGLKSKELDAYRVLVQALLRIAPQSRILACALFPRTDVEEANLDHANSQLVDLVREVNGQLGAEKVVWLDATARVDRDEHLLDHVHLNEDGYRIWDAVLYPKILELLAEVEEEKS
ncbi:acetylhydrolase [Phlyctema vagabunda]|uniref:Acetylhydrolase n=1 Tax=Phlyctema vagabunda TaxID=108571 RepID=A0ABR4PI61_9HELO